MEENSVSHFTPTPIPSDLTNKEIAGFWARVVKTEGCWLFQTKTKKRYGSIKIRGVGISAHRLAYHISTGLIPSGLLVCHTCDNTKCCNPDHLFAGTSLDNTQDMFNKGRQNKATGLRHGSRTMPHRVARGDRSGARQHPERLKYGEEHPQTTLTSEQVLEIVHRYRTERLPSRRHGSRPLEKETLAREYGVSAGTIYNIVKGNTWGHLTGLVPPGLIG